MGGLCSTRASQLVEGLDLYSNDSHSIAGNVNRSALKMLSSASLRNSTILEYTRERFSEVTGKVLRFEGSWLGNVVGGLNFGEYSFLRNTQIFLFVSQTTKVSFLLDQDSLVGYPEKRSARLYIFQMKNNGKQVKNFRKEDVYFQSRLSMNPISVTVELKESRYPYVVICTNSNRREGGYTLSMEAIHELTLKVRQDSTSWFLEPKRHLVSIQGEWNEETSTGCPETNPIRWLKNSVQIPIIATHPTRCLVRIKRTSVDPMSMGMFMVKSNGQANSEQYYAHQTLLDEDTIARSIRYTSMDTAELRVFLQPSKLPYIVIPVVEHKGQVGMFTLEILSDKPLLELKQTRIKKSFSYDGVFFERSCGGAAGTSGFFRCPQYYLTIRVSKEHGEISEFVPVTISVEQKANYSSCVPLGFFVLQGGVFISSKNYHDDRVVDRKPFAMKRKITNESRLRNNASYTIIPCPKRNNYSRDIPFTVTISTFLPSDTEIVFEPSPENSETFENLSEFKTYNFSGHWSMLSSGGSPDSSSFFNNPQYLVELSSRTKLEILLERTTEHWIPMAFFIIKRKKSNFVAKLSKLTELLKDNSGVYAPTNEFQPKDSDYIVGQIKYTSGIQKSAANNLTLGAGIYTVIVATKIPGQEGSYNLQFRSDEDIEVTEIPSNTTMKHQVEGSFHGGKCSLEQISSNFTLNPSYQCTVEKEQNVFIQLSQPENQDLSLKLFIYKTTELIQQSKISNWKSVTSHFIMSPNFEYRIVCATLPGTEGYFTLTICSDEEKIDNLQPSEAAKHVFGVKETIHKIYSGSQEWKGLCHGEDVPNDYNPQYKLVAAAQTYVHIKIQSPIPECGFSIYDSEKTVVYQEQNLQGEKEVFSRLVVLPKKDTYTLETYPSHPDYRNEYTIDIFSNDKALRCTEIPPKKYQLQIFEGCWNVNRISSSNFLTESFIHNPTWKIQLKKKSRIVLELKRETKAPSLNSENHSIVFDDLETSMSLYRLPKIVMGLFAIQQKDTKVLKPVKTKEVIAFSGWKKDNIAVCDSIFEPGDYFIVACGNTSEKQPQNSFSLHICSVNEVSVKQLSSVYKNFEPTAKYHKQTVKSFWNLINSRMPDLSQWKSASRFKFTISKDIKAKLTFLSQDSPTKLTGLVIVQSNEKSKNNPIVICDAPYIRNSDPSNYISISASKKPYYLIPYTMNQSRIGESFELLVESSLPLKLEPVAKQEKCLQFSSFWQAGVAGGKGPKSRHSFVNNPRFIMTIQNPEREIASLKLKSNTKLKTKLFIYRVDNEDYVTVDSDDVSNSQWSYSGICLSSIPSKAGKYLIIPSIYPAGSSASFSLQLCFDKGISLAEHPQNIPSSSLKHEPLRMKNIFLGESPANVLESEEDLSKINHLRFTIASDFTPLRLILQHFDVRAVSASFTVVSGSTVRRIMASHSTVASSPRVPYASRSSALMYLKKGDYMMIPHFSFENQVESPDQSIQFYVEAQYIEDVQIIPGDFYNPSEIPEAESFSVRMKNVGRVEQLILDNVSNIYLRDDEFGRFASSLCVFGDSVQPIVMGSSTTKRLITAQSRKRKDILTRKDHLGFSTEFTELEYPFVAAGTYGKGNIVAIGDTNLFNHEQLEVYDNKQFLLNCLKYAIPENRGQTDIDNIFTAYLMGGLTAYQAIDPTAEAMRSQNPDTPRDQQISKPKILVYSKNRDLIPFATMKFDYDVVFVKDINKRSDWKADIFFFIFEKDEQMSLDDIQKIQKAIERGTGAVIMGKCQGISLKAASKFPGNQILAKSGIIYQDSDVTQNTRHEASETWWLSDEQKKRYQKQLVSAVKPPAVSCSPSDVAALHHVGKCLEIYRYLKRSEKLQDPEYAEILLQVNHTLELACCTLPIGDKLIFPTLLEEFAIPQLIISEDSIVKWEESEKRFATLLNTNLWMSRPYKEMHTLEDRIGCLPGEEQKVHEVELSEFYQFEFSTGVYARSGELLTIQSPASLVGKGCKIRIGFKSQNLRELRDTDLYRYPYQRVSQYIDEPETIIANTYGGLVYILIPKKTFMNIGSSRNVIIRGGIQVPQFHLNQTTAKKWQQDLTKYDNAPYCEWISEKIIITLRTKDAELVTNPLEPLKYWSECVRSIEQLSHSLFPFTQRLLSEDQLAVGYTNSGYPTSFLHPLVWRGVIQKRARQFSPNGLIRELAHAMHGDHSYIWNYRESAIANVYKAYCLEKISSVRLSQTKFFATNIRKVVAFIGDTKLSRHERLERYQNDVSISTMLEFILIEAFGWEPYESLFEFYHEVFDRKNARQLTNQEKIDRWVVAFCKKVHSDVTDYFEKFGLKINRSTKSKTSVYQSYMLI